LRLVSLGSESFDQSGRFIPLTTRWNDRFSSRGISGHATTRDPGSNTLDLPERLVCAVPVSHPTMSAGQCQRASGQDLVPFTFEPIKKLCWQKTKIDAVIAEIRIQNPGATDGRWLPSGHPHELS
jgi:hypothetical protein